MKTITVPIRTLKCPVVVVILQLEDLIPNAEPTRITSFKSNDGITLKAFREADVVVYLSDTAIQVLKMRYEPRTREERELRNYISYMWVNRAMVNVVLPIYKESPEDV